MNKGSTKVSICKERVKEAIKYRGTSIRKMCADDGVGVVERTVRRNLSEGRISPRLLEELGRYLDVDTAFLMGKYDWPLKELPEELCQKYKEHYLKPENYPYSYRLKRTVDYAEFRVDLFALHGLAMTEYNALDYSSRLAIDEEIDCAVTKVLKKHFPRCSGVDEYHAFGRPEPNINDIIESLIDCDE